MVTGDDILKALRLQERQRCFEAMQQGDDGRVGHVASRVGLQHVFKVKVAPLRFR